MPIGKYWNDVHNREKDLGNEEYYHIMSVTNVEKGTTAGSVKRTDRERAARCLVENTHRPATPKEITKYQEAMAVQRKASEEMAAKSKQQIAMPSELTGLVKTILERGVASTG